MYYVPNQVLIQTRSRILFLFHHIVWQGHTHDATDGLPQCGPATLTANLPSASEAPASGIGKEVRAETAQQGVRKATLVGACRGSRIRTRVYITVP